MPGIDVPDSSSSSSLRQFHKTISGKRDINPADAIHFFSPEDVNPANSAAITTAPALPLTPPVLAQEGDSSIEPGLQGDKLLKSDRRSLSMVTPPRAPPMLTPEVTPPRKTSPNRLDPSPVGQLLSSSRAESFWTACETIPSDEDTDNSPSTKPLRQSKRPNVLRNGYPIDRDSLFSQPTLLDSPGWAPLNVRKREYQTEQRVVGSTEDRLPSNNCPPSQTTVVDVREQNLRDRVRDAKSAPSSAPVEQFGQDIGWPADDLPSPTEGPNSARLSGVSVTPTVEAVIIDSPPPAKRVLRHTEKRQSLRSASSPITRSERTSLASNHGSHHRLVHKAARITEQDRKSIASGPSVSACSTLGAVHSNVEVVPVVVIPERRSSLRASNQSSRNQFRVCSWRFSQHTTAASKSQISPFDRPRQRNRTLSDSTPKPFRETDTRGRTFSQPVIPPRSSSLSAPTSKNNSRAPSLTSESLRHRTLAIEQKQKGLELHETQADASGPRNQSDPPAAIPTIAVEGTSDLTPPSMPFAQGSIHSLSPGPVEISEATAVSFFPHNNNSVLVVDQQTLTGSSAVQTAPAKYPSELDVLQTPEALTRELQTDLNSPLRNPRPPQNPPVCNALSPKPTEGLDGQAGRPHDTQVSNVGLVRRFGSMRGALNARPHSSSFNSAGWSSTMSVKPPRAGKKTESSFWWPRRFWDDIENVESPRKEAPGTRSLERSQIVSNSLGMPQERIFFEGPRLDRRSPEMRRLVDGIHSASRSNLVGNRVLSPGILRAGSPLCQRRLPLISRLRLKFRPIRLRSLRKRMRRSAQRHERKKREASRQALKQSIRDLVHVSSSV